MNIIVIPHYPEFEIPKRNAVDMYIASKHVQENHYEQAEDDKHRKLYSFVIEINKTHQTTHYYVVQKELIVFLGVINKAQDQNKHANYDKSPFKALNISFFIKHKNKKKNICLKRLRIIRSFRLLPALLRKARFRTRLAQSQMQRTARS